MKHFFVFGLLVIALYGCKKDSVSPQTLSLLQNKWLMVEDSIHYPTLPVANTVYIGTPNDFYQFFTDDSVHMQFGQGNGSFNFTTAYYLKNNTDIYLTIYPNQHYTILTLTTNSLVLYNPVSNTGGGSTYTGIRITTFKR
jgi:hypothetical protein